MLTCCAGLQRKFFSLSSNMWVKSVWSSHSRERIIYFIFPSVSLFTYSFPDGWVSKVWRNQRQEFADKRAGTHNFFFWWKINCVWKFRWHKVGRSIYVAFFMWGTYIDSHWMLTEILKKVESTVILLLILISVLTFSISHVPNKRLLRNSQNLFVMSLWIKLFFQG